MVSTTSRQSTASQTRRLRNALYIFPSVPVLVGQTTSNITTSKGQTVGRVACTYRCNIGMCHRVNHLIIAPTFFGHAKCASSSTTPAARARPSCLISTKCYYLTLMLFCLLPDNVQHELQLRPLINIARKKKKITLETKPKTSLTAKPTTTLKANPKKHVVR